MTVSTTMVFVCRRSLKVRDATAEVFTQGNASRWPDVRRVVCSLMTVNAAQKVVFLPFVDKDNLVKQGV